MLGFETAIGICAVTWGDAGLTGVHLPGSKPPMPAGEAERGRLAPAEVRAAIAGIQDLLQGGAPDLSTVRLDERLVDGFQAAVLARTRQIRPGETTTYGAIARAIGRPNDARAVGGALGRNPWPIVVPCHRVLAADGALHGFSAPGGIATKRRLLEIERAPGFDQPSLFG